MRRIFAACFLLALTIKVTAQTEATAYFMKSIPQVSGSNPAFLPAYNFSIGLPGLSSSGATYTNNGFAYRDLIYRKDGQTKADLEKWNRSLTAKNYITTAAQVDLLRVGFRTGSKLYFQISAAARQYARAQLPQEITSLLSQGTTPLAASTTRFSPQVEGTAWLESAIAAAYTVNSKLTIGVRLKYLTGLANATTRRSDMSVAITDDYTITAAADVRLRTAGVDDATAKGYSFGKEFRNYMKNSGGGVDLGATYRITPRLSVAASLIDVGRIQWKNNTYDYVLNSNTAHYTFAGIDADKLVQGNSAYLSAQRDSIRSRFVFQQEKSGSYSTWLPGKFYVSGSYAIKKNFSAGLLVATERYRGRFSQGITAAICKNFGRTLSTTLTYTVSNRSANNFGAGFSLNLRPFQFYIAGDNLLNAPASLLGGQKLNSYINNTQVFSFRAGVNFIWGRGKGDGNDRRPSPATPRRSKSQSGYLKARQRR